MSKVASRAGLVLLALALPSCRASAQQFPVLGGPAGYARGTLSASPYANRVDPGFGRTCLVARASCALERQTRLGAACSCGTLDGYVSF